jgi:DNA-binding SARP family transcriptional activator
VAVVECRVLGPVEAYVDGVRVALGGPQNRAFLAVLLLNIGRVVSMDRLVDALWEETPPSTARAQVHSMVSNLRRALAAAGAPDGVIETRSPGYRVFREACHLDLTAFEEHVVAARQAMADNRVQEGVDRLCAAERLWNGPSLDGLEIAYIRAAAARLEEQRLLAVEQRAAAELGIGRHAELVAELTALVAEHPLRERLRGLAMLALYRSGRQSDALDLFHHGRAVLAEETGLDPGTELQDLAQAILRCAPALDPPVISVKQEQEQEQEQEQAPRPDAPSQTDNVPAITMTPDAGGLDGLEALPSAAAPSRKRRGRRVFGLAGAGLGLALILGGASAPVLAGHAPRPGDTLQQVYGPTWMQTPPTPVRSALFGVTMNSQSGAMPSFRVGAIRLWDSETRWSEVEPRPGEFAWDALDRLVGGAQRAHLPVLYTIGVAPKWVNPQGPPSPYPEDSTTAPPLDLSQWDDYIRSVARRYRGRIQAYELWNMANSPHYFSGSAQTLVELTRRANAIIKSIDRHATTVCPSMGELWNPGPMNFMYRFALAGGYRYCDIAAVKLYPRSTKEKPETMIELSRRIDRTFHEAGVSRPIWNTGTRYGAVLDPRLDENDADNYAVRFYLTGLFVRYERMYFYNWGGDKMPIVLQAEGGPPTRAALFINQLEDWLRGARIRSCGHGSAIGVPANVWQCRFRIRASAGDHEATILWTISGTATVPAAPAAYRINRLDGATRAVHEGDAIPVTETPILIDEKR